MLDGELIGAFRLQDKIRGEAAETVKKLNSLGIKEQLVLTGDSRENCAQAENSLGLTVYSELLPEEKLQKVKEQKLKSRAVAFVGDGINDAPVLAAADCGFAMGLGSDAAIASSDAVLSSGNLKALPNAFRIAKKVIYTVKTNIAFALLVKAAVIVLAFFGLAAIWMSVIADTGVCMICVLYAMRILRTG